MGSSPRMAAPWQHPETGNFYFRRAVPEALRPVIGKREIKVSLHTRNPSEAKQRFAAEAARCEALFAKASAGQVTPERARKIAEAWRDRIREDDGRNLIWDIVDAQHHEPGCQPEDALLRPDDWLDDVEHSGDLSRIAWAAHNVMTPEERATLNDQGRRRLGGAIATVARDYIDNTIPSTDAHYAALWAEKDKANMTISDMHKFWIDDCVPGKKTVAEWTKAKKRFVEIFGDIKVSAVTRTHAQKFRDALRKLPKNPKKDIAKLPALEQIKEIEGKNHPLLKPATINKSLLWLKRMLNLAVDNRIIENNPAERVSEVDKVAAEDKRLPYSTDDLNLIFGSVLFGGAPPEKRVRHPSLLKVEHSRWLPILGLFQGARLTELGQLRRTDIRSELGIHYLAITTLSDEDEAEVVNVGGEKSLKTRNAVRMVPLHPIVLELGFLDYVQGLKSRHLFPDLNHTSNQGPTGKFSSYWGPFTRSLGVASQKKSFHSFRHCFRDQADMMPELVRLPLMGRSRKDVYGGRPGLPMLKEWNDKVRYPGLNLDLVWSYFRNLKSQ